jgi:hypothetical protein
LPFAVKGAIAFTDELTVNPPAMSSWALEGRSVQSLKCELGTVMSFAAEFRSKDRTGTQYPDASWYATPRFAVGDDTHAVGNVIATGTANLAPEGSRR